MAHLLCRIRCLESGLITRRCEYCDLSMYWFHACRDVRTTLPVVCCVCTGIFLPAGFSAYWSSWIKLSSLICARLLLCLLYKILVLAWSLIYSKSGTTTVYTYHVPQPRIRMNLRTGIIRLHRSSWIYHANRNDFGLNSK